MIPLSTLFDIFEFFSPFLMIIVISYIIYKGGSLLLYNSLSEDRIKEILPEIELLSPHNSKYSTINGESDQIEFKDKGQSINEESKSD